MKSMLLLLPTNFLLESSTRSVNWKLSSRSKSFYISVFFVQHSKVVRIRIPPAMQEIITKTPYWGRTYSTKTEVTFTIVMVLFII